MLDLSELALVEPEWYCREVLGVNAWAKQLEIIESIKAHEKTLVTSCVASGKTFIAAATIPWWLHTRYPARVFTIAPTERQLKINIWGELSRIHANTVLPLGGDLITLNWKLSENWYAKGFSPKDALAVFGIHGPNDLVLFDDAQGVASDVFDAFENATAGGTTKFLFLCNPTMVSGPLYEAITSRRGDMHVIQIDADHTPNVMAGKVVIPGLITKEKRDEWVAKYGWDSDFVRVKVRALPPKQEPDTLIPIDWLELAKARELDPILCKGPAVMGVDVARFGDDESIICVKRGRQLLPIEPEWVMSGNDTMQVSGRVIATAKTVAAARANIDEIGVGGGVVDRTSEVAREHGMALKVHGVNVAEKAHQPDRFVNLRAEMWWAAHESLDPKNPTVMALPPDDALLADLSAMKYTVDSAGRIKVESKEETKKRLGRSPDRGDAYALAVFESYTEGVRPAVAFAQNPMTPKIPSFFR